MTPPAVEDARPPAGFVKVANPVMKALLASPLHRLVSGNLMLLTMTGRRSGRTITVPVGRLEAPDGTFELSAAGAWRHNLRDGADVRLTLDGRERSARAEVETDPERKVEGFKALIDRVGARSVALKVNVDRPPTLEELRPAVAGRDLAYLRLTD